MVERGSKEVTEHVGDWIDKVIEELGTEAPGREFYHYTTISNLFNILEGDSLWLSNMRFSNDDSEGTVLREKGIKELDNYIACFCDKGDCLSQWRGYCPEGGASIEMELNEIQQYSILNANYDSNKKFEIYNNTPFPVMYVEANDKELGVAVKTIEKTRELFNWEPDESPELKDIISYLKNDKFIEERELRLAFSNIGGTLSDCIRFRALSNGVMIPYIVIMAGNIGKNSMKCRFNPDNVDSAYLDSLCDSGCNVLWIPEGSNQESIFNKVNQIVQEYNDKMLSIDSYVHIFCKGHLPIRRITISPMYGQARIREQVERYCYSKYWLRNVEVVCSEIPYIKSV